MFEEWSFMKFRTDFVSNSSSCSFVVSDVISLMKLLAPIGEMPYAVEDKLHIQICCKDKDYDQLYEIIYGEKSPSYYNYDRTPRDPDELAIFDIRDYNTFISRWSEVPDSIKSGVKNFYISCDDYEIIAVSVINSIYELCDVAGLNPDDSYSEIQFRTSKTDQQNFLINLGSKIQQLKDSK